jgi:hypothetical protein
MLKDFSDTLSRLCTAFEVSSGSNLLSDSHALRRNEKKETTSASGLTFHLDELID